MDEEKGRGWEGRGGGVYVGWYVGGRGFEVRCWMRIDFTANDLITRVERRVRSGLDIVLERFCVEWMLYIFFLC